MEIEFLIFVAFTGLLIWLSSKSSLVRWVSILYIAALIFRNTYPIEGSWFIFGIPWIKEFFIPPYLARCAIGAIVGVIATAQAIEFFTKKSIKKEDNQVDTYKEHDED